MNDQNLNQQVINHEKYGPFTKIKLDQIENKDYDEIEDSKESRYLNANFFNLLKEMIENWKNEIKESNTYESVILNFNEEDAIWYSLQCLLFNPCNKDNQSNEFISNIYIEGPTTKLGIDRFYTLFSSSNVNLRSIGKSSSFNLFYGYSTLLKPSIYLNIIRFEEFEKDNTIMSIKLPLFKILNTQSIDYLLELLSYYSKKYPCLERLDICLDITKIIKFNKEQIEYKNSDTNNSYITMNELAFTLLSLVSKELINLKDLFIEYYFANTEDLDAQLSYNHIFENEIFHILKELCLLTKIKISYRYVTLNDDSKFYYRQKQLFIDLSLNLSTEMILLICKYSKTSPIKKMHKYIVKKILSFSQLQIKSSTHGYFRYFLNNNFY